ncbi:hypothetical protein NE237_017457 [Protea cynaroides]|uniref:Serpin domain-containing protein n=1 Tax=Protea cynaroides TaxID=273540 RepID=A0A9Q0QN16_9MAGN|nr:hypothetical protein NE237_017457 [Protea cynaroides]
MDLQQLFTNQTDFSLEIAKSVLLKEAKDSNVVFSPLSVHVVLSLIVVFSPLSVHVVLSLIAAGFKGPTLDQILSFLRSKSNGELNSFASETRGSLLSFANGVWIDKLLSLKASFKDIIDNVYKAVSIQVDFQTKGEKETSGLIKEVLPPGSVDSSTKLIFANALYFKGTWRKEGSIHVPFMTSKKKQFVCAYDGFKVLRLPYRQGVDKRCFSCTSEMVDSILGKNLCVSSVFRKSYIEVNEEGTDASTFRV